MNDEKDTVGPALAIMQLMTTAVDYSLSWDETQRRRQEVIDASRLAVEAHPEDAFLTYLYGLALYRAYNLPGAAQVLERLDNLEIAPGMEMYDYLLAECYTHVSCGRPDDAFVRYKKIVQRLNEHEAWLRNEGGDLDRRGKFPGVGENGDFAFAPDNLVAKPDEVCRETGKFLSSRGDDADAEQCLTLACALLTSPYNYRALGHFFSERERWVEAEAVFRSLEDRFPDDESANMLGRCLQEQGRLDEAEAAFHLALTRVDDTGMDMSITPAAYNNLGYLYWEQGRVDDAVEAFKRAMAHDEVERERYLFRLAELLTEAGRDTEAEFVILESFSRTELATNSEDTAKIFNLLGEIRLKHRDRWLDALAMFGESIRRVATNPEVWANRARAERRLGLLYDAEQSLEEALELAPNKALFKSRLDDILFPHCSTHYESFPEFLEDGEIWLDPAKWTNPENSSVLRSIFTRDLRWPNYVEEFPFGDYEITAEFLDESLARAESLKSLLNFEVEFPVRLETPELFIAMERDGDMLRSFVGSGAMGVAVSVNLNNWDLHYLSDDSDAMFAAGVSLNFFIDCSMNLSLHPKYERVDETTTEPAATQTNPFSTWTTNAAFAADVEGILTGRLSQPPKAHRVKGFIRTLTERRPTDEARDRAPAFIRRNMGPDDTFVRPHQRGGGDAAERLYTRLRTHSSLADFLATAPKF